MELISNFKNTYVIVEGRLQMKMKLLSSFIMLIFFGCVGSPIHSTLSYHSVSEKIKKNNKALLKLKVGMTKDEVQQIMGEPQRSEGYPWGSVWLYRTAMTEGINGSIYGTIDPDYTPVMFDENVNGWGRNYFQEYIRKYELTIKSGS